MSESGGNRVIGRLVAIIDGDLTGLQRAIGDVQKTLRGAGRTMTDAGRALSLGVTAPLLAIGGIAAKASIDFESAFAGVRKTVDATEEQFAQLRQGIRDMAKVAPASATEIAKVAEAAGQLGVQTENLLDFTRTMIMLGETTNLSADEAATALAQLTNITGLPQDQVDELASAVVALGNAGASTEADIVAMALRIAGAGSTVGLTEAQIVGFAAALSDVGIEAEAGGSAISRVMIEMANAVASGGKDLQNFAAAAGMSADEFSEAFRSDPAGAIVAFVEGLGGISEAGGNVFATLDQLGLSEIRVRDALLRLAGNSDGVAESLRRSDQAWEENTALTDEYAKRAETTAAKLEILRNKLNDTAITLGDALVPAAMAALTAAEPLIGVIASLAEGFANLPQPVQTGIIAFGAMMAALGPMLIMFGQMAFAVKNLLPVLQGLPTVLAGVRTAVMALGTALLTPPVGLVVALVALGVAAYIFRDEIAAVFNYVRDKVLSALRGVMAFAREHWPEIAVIIAGPFGPLVALATDGFGIRTALIEAFGNVIDFLKEVPGQIVDAFGDAANLLVEVGKAIMKGLWEGMKSVAGDMLDWVQGLGGEIKKLKGPIEKDRKLLVPEGLAIMAGLGEGLAAGFRRDVSPLLSSTAMAIAAGYSPPAIPALTTPARAFVGMGSASTSTGAGTNGGFNFQVNEMNVYEKDDREIRDVAFGVQATMQTELRRRGLLG